MVIEGKIILQKINSRLQGFLLLVRECQEYAERHGLTIIGSYIDRALSAKTDDRPEFQRMIKDSAKKLFEVVLVWKLDRFSRSRTDSAMYKHILKKSDVRVVSAKESISKGPEGIILEAMLEGMAEYYSAELAEKVLRGMTENALKCKYNGGSVPMGYSIDSEKHYQIDPVTAPIIQEIFTRYADGETIVDIAASLNSRGIRSPWGNKFNTNSSIHNILKNRKYMGEYRYRDVVQPDGIPAIVTPELFERVEARMARNKKAPAAAKAEEPYILTTKLFCGSCGAFMAGESGRSRSGVVHHYYKCSKAKRNNGCKKKAVRKDYIERLVVAETKRLVLQDDTVNRLAKAIVELQNRESTALPLLKQQLREAEKGIENMLNAIQQGIITSSTKQRLEELEARKAELEITIAQEQMQKPTLTKEQIVLWISRFKDGDIDDPTYRQTIVDVFVNAVYLYDDKIMLLYNYKDGAKTVTLQEVSGSDLEGDGPPAAKWRRPDSRITFCGSRFCIPRGVVCVAAGGSLFERSEFERQGKANNAASTCIYLYHRAAQRCTQIRESRFVVRVFVFLAAWFCLSRRRWHPARTSRI